ncbi:hypothetical protein ACAG39_09475 [Caldicellulosiruptoraceae bacterium PP1]
MKIIKSNNINNNEFITVFYGHNFYKELDSEMDLNPENYICFILRIMLNTIKDDIDRNTKIWLFIYSFDKADNIKNAILNTHKNFTIDNIERIFFYNEILLNEWIYYKQS